MPPKRSSTDLSFSAKRLKGDQSVSSSCFQTVGGGEHSQGGLLLSNHNVSSKPAFAFPEWIISERARLVTTTDFFVDSSTSTEDGEALSDVLDPKVEGDPTCVLYWMSRDQRAEDNWALTMARHSAMQLGLPLVVCFNLVPSFLGATLRQFGFMLHGLAETEATLRSKQIPFYLLRGANPGRTVADFASGGSLSNGKPQAQRSEGADGESFDTGSFDTGVVRAAVVFTDFSPLRVPMAWVKEGAKCLAAEGIPLVQVDAHNIVPVWVASDKQEVGARTLRKKIHAHLPRFLANEPPSLAPNDMAEPASSSSSSSSSTSSSSSPTSSSSADGQLGAASSSASRPVAMPPPTDWDHALASLVEGTLSVAPGSSSSSSSSSGGGGRSGGLDTTVGLVDWAKGGATAGHAKLKEFCEERLLSFDASRNDPTNEAALSDLSPWLHFGQVAPQRAVLQVKKAAAAPGPGSGGAKSAGKDSYIEEAVVRRELSDNFCFYNAAYDRLEGAAGWAQETLQVHSADPREHVYTSDALEAARTHDDLWNAAQLQLAHHGKMHGFLRMYWAKKILEWSPDPAEALRVSIWLNDKYSLDGRDPNGYVGCMWSVCGVHDMGWTERPVFGKIRYMNYAGCTRKFDVHAFVSRFNKLGASANAVQAGGTPAEPKKKKKGGKGKKGALPDEKGGQKLSSMWGTEKQKEQHKPP